jgi:hypothetical protein
VQGSVGLLKLLNFALQTIDLSAQDAHFLSVCPGVRSKRSPTPPVADPAEI